MAGKKIALAKPAKTEANLADYDQHELQVQRDFVAQAKACAASAKLAKEEIAKLNKQKASINKKDPDANIISQEISRKIEIHTGVAMTKCNLSQSYCMPANNAKKILTPRSMGDELNKSYGTKIDFEQLSFFEGGEHTVAYIPWWPYLKNDKPKIQFYQNTSAKNLPRLSGEISKEPKNKSGTTIGIGVDLGQDSAANFLEKMKRRNVGSTKISEKELIELHQKIAPYFQKFGGEACQFLRENPLVLTDKESHFLNKVAHDEALHKVIGDYKSIADKKGGKKFSDLTVEQQTALLSNGYQHGTASRKLINAIISGNSGQIPKDLREYPYLYRSMSHKK